MLSIVKIMNSFFEAHCWQNLCRRSVFVICVLRNTWCDFIFGHNDYRTGSNLVLIFKKNVQCSWGSETWQKIPFLFKITIINNTTLQTRKLSLILTKNLAAGLAYITGAIPNSRVTIRLIIIIPSSSRYSLTFSSQNSLRIIHGVYVC
jgi:hypothetical protein